MIEDPFADSGSSPPPMRNVPDDLTIVHEEAAVVEGVVGSIGGFDQGTGMRPRVTPFYDDEAAV